MNELFNSIIGQCASALKLREQDIPPELARTHYIFNLFDLHCRNWQAGPLRKIYSMRARMRFPLLDILGMAFHPAADYELPIFLFDLSRTGKKIITYINVFAALDTPEYRKTYMQPFEQVRERYSSFAPVDMPAWMQYYRTGSTIYSHPGPGALPEIIQCIKEYFSLYLPMATSAAKITDPAKAAAVKNFHARFVEDVLTKDGSRIMLGRVIGQKKAGRLFHEVLT